LLFWGDQLEWRADRVVVDLVLLADSTAINIISDECGHPWPPIIPLNKDLGGKASGVSRRYSVVVFLYHISVEDEVIGYVTSVLVED